MFTFYTGEWWPYAFSPILQSFGGDLLDRDTYLSAEGVLNGENAVAFGNWFQNCSRAGWPIRPRPMTRPSSRAARPWLTSATGTIPIWWMPGATTW